jgi:hypothetical protein
MEWELLGLLVFLAALFAGFVGLLKYENRKDFD